MYFIVLDVNDQEVFRIDAAVQPLLSTNPDPWRQGFGHLNPFFVPVADAKALVTAMAHFLDDPEFIACMGQRGRKIAEEKYDVNKVNAQMLKYMGVTE